eukprot:9950605-Alexandrium_andersonii.AAC.1
MCIRDRRLSVVERAPPALPHPGGHQAWPACPSRPRASEAAPGPCPRLPWQRQERTWPAPAARPEGPCPPW